VQQSFKVPEVSCGHCKSAIEGALGGVEGVTEAEVDIEAK
jgi:copper chaperone